MNEVTTQAKLRVERARARFGWFDVAVSTFRRYSSDGGGSYAAALTYYVFFSIFPLLLAGTAVLAFFTRNDPLLRKDIIDAGVDAVPLIRDVLRPDGLSFIEQRANGIAITAVIMALYSGSGAVVALEHALNKVNRVTQEGTFVQKRIRSLRWLAILGAGALASLALSGAASFAGGLAGDDSTFGSVVRETLAVIGGLVVSGALFATAFKFLPRTSSSWSEVVPGAVAAAVAFEVLKAVGALYLKVSSGTREATFGTFTTAAGLLVASYLVSQIVLVAGELNAVLAERRATRQSQVGDSAGRTTGTEEAGTT